jgi:hypothetical protein
MGDEQDRTTSEPAATDTEVTVEVAAPTAGGVGQDDIEALRQAYLNQLEEAKREEQATLDNELLGVEKLNQNYLPDAQAAAAKVGLDPDAMQADFAQIAQLKDSAEREQQYQELQARYAPLVNETIDLMGVDRASAQKELTDVVGELSYPHVADLERQGLIGRSAWTEPGDIPPPPPPPPQSTQKILTAPYGLSATSGWDHVSADRATGALSNSNDIYVAGAVQKLAAVGSPFFVEANVRRVRVETTVDVGNYSTIVGACLGYAWAEAILNLKVVNGSSLVTSNRKSLSWSMAVILWISMNSGSGQYTLACEFDHSYGTPRTYAAMAEIETWAVGGGIPVAPASAWAYGRPGSIIAYLMR